MSNAAENLFDYSAILIKMDKLCKDLHYACLHNQTEGALDLTDEMVVQARMLRAWLNDNRAA